MQTGSFGGCIGKGLSGLCMNLLAARTPVKAEIEEIPTSTRKKVAHLNDQASPKLSTNHTDEAQALFLLLG